MHEMWFIMDGRLGRYVPLQREAEDPAAVRSRGELVMGMRIQQERAFDRAEGRPHRELCPEELCCLEAAEQAELSTASSTSCQGAPAPPRIRPS